MQLLLPLIAGGLAAYLGWRYISQGNSGNSAQTKDALRWLTIIAAGVFLLLLMARAGPAALALLSLAAPIIIAIIKQRARFKSATTFDTSTSDSQSQVVTQFLNMTLNHNDGSMQGEVIAGQFKGAKLADLSFNQLLMLWQECQADPQSAAVLEAYLDHTQPDDWREQVKAQAGAEQQQQNSASATITATEEAYAILGLPVGASREEIKAAHRRLMQRLHPDHGGSDYLAARINEAKALLLEE